ncbi:MAG: hypothetical protein ACI8S6_003115 [Myxococcota bacterium]|jgi:hypothetical protein
MHDDDDPLWESIVAQVDAALDNAELVDAETRAALLDGVRAAMDTLKPEPQPQPEPGPPNISVLPGGRDTSSPPTPSPPRPKLRVAAKVSQGARILSRGPGGICLSDGGGVQTILRAPVSRAYRLSCTSGWLRILAEGQPVASLLPEQSIDIEAALIQVSSEAAARGSYRRLTAGPAPASRDD